MSRGCWLRTSLAAALAATVLLGTPPGVTAQEGTIRGVVQSERTLLPVPGAQVELVGTGRAVVTDASGRFMFVGVSGTQATLRVTMLGYRTVDHVARVGDMNVVIRLAETAIELDQLVVTGTAGGTQRRAIGNSVTQIRASETVELAHVANVQSLLNARAPGLVITPGTGMVGSGSQIRIRGSNSFSLSNQPLLYVDGVRVDNAQATGPAVQDFGSSVISRINDFNPDDIESIEIIKGPAAATLYGTEASNGVIHIITKRGRQGAPAWNLTIRQGANWFMNSIERTPVNYWKDPNTGIIHSINLAKTEKERGTPLYRTGHVQGYSLSLSGGSADVRYYLAGDFDNEEGAQWDNSQRRASLRANLNIMASPTLELAASVGYTGGRTYLSCEAGCGGVTWASYFSTPERAQGNLNPDPRGARSQPPEYYNEAFTDYQDLARFTGSLQLNHRPVSWFHQRLTLGLDDVREDNQSITEKSELLLLWSPTARGGKSVSRRDVINHTIDYSGTFQFAVNPRLTSNTSFGAQYYRRYSEFVSAQGVDFATPGLRVINAAAETYGGETYSENVTVGVYGQQQFNWQDRLFVTAALRADDNSAFGEEFDLVWYPKASLAWVVSEEPFWGLSQVNALRLRAAYGEAGQQPGAFDALRTYASVPGPNDISTVTPSSVGNPNLGPERSSEIELGFEAGLFEDRIGVDFTWYNQTTRDAILLRPSAPSTGFPGSRYVNIGKVRNRGFEALVRGTLLARPSFTWDATFSVARNENKILHISDDEDRIVVSGDFGVEHRVGYPLGAWFHRRVVSAQFDADGRVILESMMCDDGEGGTTPCYNEEGAVVAPAVYLGRGEPKYEGTISTTLAIGERIRIYGLMDFKAGFKKWDHVTRVRCSLYTVCHENVEPLQYVDKAPARLAAYQTGAVFGAEYIRDSKFLRLREVSVGYTLPTEFAQRFGATRASVTLAARNLHTWTPWTGMDPEARFLSGSRGGFGPLEQNHLPQLTSFVTTINLSF
ncbi:MAG: SusC/RagA family TonB-linked outer membrane protein [bacterium]|jgi:TonB-linked SusC/RagA family outer membrane protein